MPRQGGLQTSCFCLSNLCGLTNFRPSEGIFLYFVLGFLSKSWSNRFSYRCPCVTITCFLLNRNAWHMIFSWTDDADVFLSYGNSFTSWVFQLSCVFYAENICYHLLDKVWPTRQRYLVKHFSLINVETNKTSHPASGLVRLVKRISWLYVHYSEHTRASKHFLDEPLSWDRGSPGATGIADSLGVTKIFILPTGTSTSSLFSFPGIGEMICNVHDDDETQFKKFEKRHCLIHVVCGTCLQILVLKY